LWTDKYWFRHNKMNAVKWGLTSKKPYLCPPCQKMPIQAAGVLKNKV
jgi:hypothetical protein